MSVHWDIQRDDLYATTGTGACRHEECRSTIGCWYGDALRLIAAATSCCFLRPGRVFVESFSQILAHLKYLIACEGKEQTTHIPVGENCKWHDDGVNNKKCCKEMGRMEIERLVE